MNRELLIWLILTLIGTAGLAGFFWGPVFGINLGPYGFIACGMACLMILGYRDIREASQRANARSKKMQEAAEQMQFSFYKKSPCNVLGWPQSFRITQGELQKAENINTTLSEGYLGQRLSAWIMPENSNVIQGAVADAQIAIFDFKCDKPGRSKNTMSVQTVLAIQTPRLNFPHFALLPSTFWSKINDHFQLSGASPLPPPDGYKVIAEDTTAAKDLIPRLTDWLDGETSIEAGEEFLMVYRMDKLVEPEKVQNLVTLGLHIYEALTKCTYPNHVEPVCCVQGESRGRRP